MAIFKIHPAIGIARLGDSESDFYLSPEQPGQLPIACDGEGRAKLDDQGNEIADTTFKDSSQRVKQQAARFRVFAYRDEDDEAGHEITVGETFPFQAETSTTGRFNVEGTVIDIEWTVHLANKKSSWYQFMQLQGMHGYEEPSKHPLREPHVKQPDARRQLIIDPGPQTVSYTEPEARHKTFAKGDNPGYPQTFPPPDIAPNSITTLGEVKVNCQDDSIRLIVLGGHGNSGSTNPPLITGYANSAGWFDDISDGPITARIKYEYYQKIKVGEAEISGEVTIDNIKIEEIITIDEEQYRKRTGYAEIDVPAWVVIGYPRYAPELVDMITMDEALYDLFVRKFAFDPQVYGVPPFDNASNSPKTETEWRLWHSEAQWNPNYYPKFYKEIWPVLKRPDTYTAVYGFDPFEGGVPHNTGTEGNLDEDVMSVPPQHGQSDDINRQKRAFIYNILRKPGGGSELGLHF
ncbi:LodA/GoxA family CTQ-dependent oxidase [Chloroflexi bacterium TSY]|nr:LodA/GoxA family CTQ-dependent oxidase [Chloroflexi bacterium TSY]